MIHVYENLSVVILDRLDEGSGEEGKLGGVEIEVADTDCIIPAEIADIEPVVRPQSDVKKKTSVMKKKSTMRKKKSQRKLEND